MSDMGELTSLIDELKMLLDEITQYKGLTQCIEDIEKLKQIRKDLDGPREEMEDE